MFAPTDARIDYVAQGGLRSRFWEYWAFKTAWTSDMIAKLQFFSWEYLQPIFSTTSREKNVKIDP